MMRKVNKFKKLQNQKDKNVLDEHTNLISQNEKTFAFINQNLQLREKIEAETKKQGILIKMKNDLEGKLIK